VPCVPTFLPQRACAAFALAAACLSVHAQDYPSRPIRFIVGFVPGGVADLLARALGQKLTEAWGQQVIIDNRAGAGGIISMQIAGKSAPDGHTLLMGSSTQFSITPALQSNLPYDPIRDYMPLSRAAITPVMLTVQATHPARTLQDLVKLAKAKPDSMSYGSTGYGGGPHIAGEHFRRAAGIEIQHIPFKGGGEAVTALLGGHVHMSFGAVSTSLPHLRSGRMRALGVTSAKRLTAVPDVPAFAEAGLPGFEVVQWFGVFAPAGLPQPIVSRLNAALVKALAAQDLRDRFAAQGVEAVSSNPAEFAAYVKNEAVRWARALKEMGISGEPPK